MTKDFNIYIQVDIDCDNNYDDEVLCLTVLPACILFLVCS